MNQPKPGITFLLLLFICHVMSSGDSLETQMVTFHVTNNCDFPIWPATAPNVGQPVIADGGFLLRSDRTKRVQAPSDWSGRLWARTGCNFTCNSPFTNFTCLSKPACQTGDCQGLLSCNGTTGLPPATLIEVSLQPNSSLPSFYDVSVVDGYNLPVSVSTKPADANCSIGGCTKNMNDVCPKELRVLDRSRAVVACKSACMAFDKDAYCCRKEFGKAESCKANKCSKVFKDACPSYVSYAYDTQTSLMSCSSKEFVITFCPSKWSAHQSMR